MLVEFDLEVIVIKHQRPLQKPRGALQKRPVSGRIRQRQFNRERIFWMNARQPGIPVEQLLHHWHVDDAQHGGRIEDSRW